MTFDEYIQALHRLQSTPAMVERRKQREARALEECGRRGFWEISARPFSEGGCNVIVTPGSPPNDFSRRGFMHRHCYFELMYVYQGECVHKLPQETMLLHAGDVVLLNPNVLHCVYVEGPEDILLNVWIRTEFVRQTVLPLLYENSLFTSFFIEHLFRFSEAARFLYFPDTSLAVRQTLHLLCQESLQKPQYYKTTQESALLILFSMLAREYLAGMPDLTRPVKNAQIYDVLLFIEQHLAEVSLEALARRFPYSPAYISRLIKEHTGSSFTQLVLARRLERAAECLLSTRCSVADIAGMLGFADIAYFNRTFKEKYRCTPTAFRKSEGAPP